MPEPNLVWQIQPPLEPPAWFIQEVKRLAPATIGLYGAQLLWQRGITDAKILPGFLNPALYQPASPFDFGEEMEWAVNRVRQAIYSREKVAIWGDFDADGVTATAVLWDGLGEFLDREKQLGYYIPNRLTESHGLNFAGIDKLKNAGTSLIITCDTGSTNIEEIKYAGQLGIDVIVTDHHTLPSKRPPVVAIINPRYLPPEHPMLHLSGVAVAYKFIEALYQVLPTIPQRPLEDLLDLVAIGLIADLVQLSGDCRYLAQRGIARLKQQLCTRPTRPGVARLLKFCQGNGDRPTDISFGIGPRINAVSRIQGDASFCLELLTSKNEQRCFELAFAAELANSRRKSLQKEVVKQVKQRLEKMDLSTTCVIVLEDPQWHPGVLGLVAGQIAQEYGIPTVLLSSQDADFSNLETAITSAAKKTEISSKMARGSARSANNIDLYELVQSQAYLLHRFGGHPFAAGLSLPVENIPLFTEAINRQLRQKIGVPGVLGVATVQADLIVPVADLGEMLFLDLNLVEPCGMGNPQPKLLIKNCWFEKVDYKNITDIKGQKVQYIKTEFKIWDNSSNCGFPGVWWGHYQDEIPQGRCDAIVELYDNQFQKRHEVRLIALRPAQEITEFQSAKKDVDWILDRRPSLQENKLNYGNFTDDLESFILVQECPISWDDLQVWFRQAMQRQKKLALAYDAPEIVQPAQIWQQLVGVAKYLIRTDESIARTELCRKLGISNYALYLGLNSLANFGISSISEGDELKFILSNNFNSKNTDKLYSAVEIFCSAVREEQFRRDYFCNVTIDTIKSMVHSL